MVQYERERTLNENISVSVLKHCRWFSAYKTRHVEEFGLVSHSLLAAVLKIQLLLFFYNMSVIKLMFVTIDCLCVNGRGCREWKLLLPFFFPLLSPPTPFPPLPFQQSDHSCAFTPPPPHVSIPRLAVVTRHQGQISPSLISSSIFLSLPPLTLHFLCTDAILKFLSLPVWPVLFLFPLLVSLTSEYIGDLKQTVLVVRSSSSCRAKTSW